MKLHSLLLSAVLGLALSGPATAAVYTGIWDPPFGADLPNLGWRGSATFSVPNSCEVLDGLVSNAGDCAGAAVVTAATVELYDVADEMGLLATIVLDPLSIVIASLQYAAGELEQIDSGLSSAVALGVDLSLPYNAPPGTTFSLMFTLDGPRLYFNCIDDVPGNCAGGNDNAAFPAAFVITRVPEPASLALSGLALAGLLALRRRRLPAVA